MGARLGPLSCGSPQSRGGQLAPDLRRRGEAGQLRDVGLRLVTFCLSASA